MTSIEIFDSADVLNLAAAETFARLTARAVDARATCAVALAGGSTPRGVYRALAEIPALRAQVPWDRMQFFWGDERHVPPDHADSNYRMAFDAMLSKVPVPEAQIHRIRSETADADSAARQYEDEIRPVLSPSFDLVHLGLGKDGHTASLFPGTAALEEWQRLCVANWVPALRVHRITLTFPILNAARAVMFTVSGADKASIVRDVLRRKDAEPRLPAQRVQPSDGDLLWMLDRAAASGL
jgi:6-phosphogluconolactonase